MSAQLFSDLRRKLSHIRDERDELMAFSKMAFIPSPAMPQGPPPPMDPAMTQGGMPPVDPATGMPMQGPPPMDPAMMPGGMPPVDPATGMPMDPAMMGAPPAAAPPLTPEAVDQILGLLEEMGQQMQGLQQESQQFRQQVEQALNELNDQMLELDQRAAQSATVPPAV